MTALSASTARLVFDGDQTIRDVETARARLLDALAAHAVVEINFDDATTIDVSMIQLILAARNSAQRRGRTLILSHPAYGVLRDSLTRGGFIPAATDRPVPGAVAAPPNDVFWSKGATA